MVRKVAALWLVLLIVLPFSAPFPTCGLADLLGGSRDSRDASVPASSGRAVVDDATSLLVPPVAAAAGRLKLTALSGLRSLESVAPALTPSVESPVVHARFGTPPPLNTSLRI